jgi:hypothetical protein
MLTDREPQVLRELEDRITADDPVFARSFTVREQHTSRSAQGPAIAAVVVALLLGVPLLVMGSVVGALALAVTAGLVWFAW